MFVGQVEDHGLLADLLLAHQAGLHAGHALAAAPPNHSSSAPAWSVSTPPATMASHVSSVGIVLSPRTHYTVVVFEHIPVRHSVVNGEVVTHLGLVRTILQRTFVRRNLAKNISH